MIEYNKRQISYIYSDMQVLPSLTTPQKPKKKNEIKSIIIIQKNIP